MNHSELSVIALPPRNAATDAAWQALHRAATAAYRGDGRGFSWHFARGKLAHDPVFRAMLERGYLSQRRRVVDIGCGQGLLSSLLQACNELQHGGRWPAAWPEPPAAAAYTGIELMPRDVARAEKAAGRLALAPRFVCADMRDAALPACDAVVILDVLHYVDHADQSALLQRVRDALAPRGRLLLRVGDVADRRRFVVSQWVDRVVAGVRGHRVPPTWGRTLAEWRRLLEDFGFTVRSVPMSSGTPFANVLMVADLHGGGAPMKPLAVAAHTLVSALGSGRDANFEALRSGRTGLAQRDFETARLGAWLGIVDGIDELRWPAEFAAFDCRNNRLAELGLRADGFADSVQRAARRWGTARIGVFLGTSTSGILQTELAYRRRDPVSGALPADLHYAETHNTYSLARYVRARLGLAGPAHVVSTACSSSAKVYATAARMIALGLVDAAVVGGVDSLCLTTLYGFRSLELMAADICRPWDAERAGLSIGEAAAFALLERDAERPLAWLLGSGESSDGHHMSSPHPGGAGAALAMRAALAQAGLAAADVDYLNLHGTGTPGNDAAEDRAVCSVFGTSLACSSTKGFTGHTLGAAGGVEASITMLALQHGLAPAGLNLRRRDPTLQARYIAEPLLRPLAVAASNSFGFGGSNACLVFGAAR